MEVGDCSMPVFHCYIVVNQYCLCFTVIVITLAVICACNFLLDKKLN
jgi:hypothetical protein